MCTQPAQPLKVITCSTAETRALGRALGELLPPGSIVALVGDLGAGKTCLTAGLALGLGIAEPISSPTFNLVLEYDEPNARLPLYHFDTYRLTDRAEFEQLGLAIRRGGIVSLVGGAHCRSVARTYPLCGLNAGCGRRSNRCTKRLTVSLNWRQMIYRASFVLTAMRPVDDLPGPPFNGRD